MDFDDYQSIARETDQFAKANRSNEHILIPLLGLAGETGTMLSEFKKKLRDKEAVRPLGTDAVVTRNDDACSWGPYRCSVG